ncbi:alanine racemase [Citrobacter koseri]|uniref:Alanine racemase, catabolic n=1 Tax=Citrobacter koseri TaxID=545 RepID=A0A447UGI4_CITKO|nr:alanine racemase [Citrobacter koseri]
MRTGTVGTVSMDMLAVDLTPCPQAGIGTSVELWGKEIKIDDVASAAGTVGYETDVRAGAACSGCDGVTFFCGAVGWRLCLSGLQRAECRPDKACQRRHPAASPLFHFIPRDANPDLTHGVVFFLCDRPDHAGKLHLVAHNRRGAQQLLHDFPQRLLFIAIFRSLVQAVNQGDVSKFRIGFENKIAEKTLIQRDRRRLAEQFAQRRKVALTSNNAQNVAFA